MTSLGPEFIGMSCLHCPVATPLQLLSPISAARGSGGAEEARNYPRKNWRDDIKLPFPKCVF